MLNPSHPIDLMLTNFNFQTAVFMLSYRGEAVARITYKPSGAPNSISTTTTNATQLSIPPLPHSNPAKQLLQIFTDANTTSVDTADPTNYPRLEVSFRLTGSVITIYEIFYLALDTLREIARFGRTGRLADSTIQVTAADLKISTRGTDPPRTAQNPPYFQIEWLMRAVAQTPAYMLEQRSFREVELVLFVNEVKVGEVSIMRPNAAVDVSIS